MSRRSIGIAAAASCLVALTACSGPSSGADSPSAAPPTSSPAVAPSSAPPSPSKPNPNDQKVQVVLSDHDPLRLIRTGRSVYAAYPGPIGASGLCTTRIARLDTRTGLVVRSPAFVGGFDLAVAGGRLWASGTPLCSGTLRQGAKRSLTALDLRTLAIERRITLPQSPGPLASSPAGLWIGTPGHLYLMDPRTGRVGSSVPVQGMVGALSVDPTGRRLYVSTYTWNKADGVEDLPITERDAQSGTLIHVAHSQFGYAPNWLWATWGGVWVSTVTGNFGSAFLLGRNDLQVGPSIDSGHGVRASVVDGHLWIQDVDGETLRCANSTTGAVLGTVITTDVPRDYGLFSTNVVGVARNVYVGGSAGLVRIPPPAACE